MELQILETQNLLGKDITVYGDYENPLFLAKDVAEWIEHSKPSIMLDSIDEDEKLKETIFTSGQNREVWMLTENGLYEVFMQSRKPIAKELKKGIKHILKEVRTKGGYIATHSEDTPEMIMARGMEVAMATIEKFKASNQKLISENAKLQTKSEFVDKVFDSDVYLTFSQVAKTLNLPYGRNILFRKLRELGILFKNSNEPKQIYVDKGYFKVSEIWNEALGKPILQTVVSQKGLAFIGLKLGAITNHIEKINIQ